MKIQQIAASQAQKEVVANENFDSVSVAADFSRNPTVSGGLVWGYYGGVIFNNGTLTQIASGTLNLTANLTNYIEVSVAGVVSVNTTGFTAGKIPLYSLVVGATTVTTITDYRTLYQPYAYSSRALSDADYTLSDVRARCNFINFTGALTAARSMIYPAIPWQAVIKNSTTGGFQLNINCGGVSAAVPAGGIKTIVCDGVDCFVV